MEKPGFVLTYTSYRALEADHSAYMTHGAMVVSMEADEAPAHDTDAVLRIVAPTGDAFDIPIKTGHYLKGRGIMTSFDADGVAQQAALEDLLKTHEFKTGLQEEPETEKAKPLTSRFTPTAASAPAVAAPVEEDNTDVTAAPRRTSSGGQRDTRRALKPRGRSTSKSGGAVHTGETELRKPSSGEKYVVYVVKFLTVLDYLDVHGKFEDHQLFDVPMEDEVEVNTPCMLRLQLPGHNVYEVWGVVEQTEPEKIIVRCDENDDAYRRAVLHPTTVSSKARLQRETDDQRQPVRVLRIEEEVPDEDLEKMPIRRRLARMGMDDKINLALSGDREERMALAMDSNKAIHHYLLKNAKITLDEIAFMARLPSLNPDVLDRIAENPGYVQNPTVCKALVYNPRTPVRTAIRLLDRLPRSEVMNLAKRTNMNLRLVMAAKKKIERRSI